MKNDGPKSLLLTRPEDLKFDDSPAIALLTLPPSGSNLALLIELLRSASDIQTDLRHVDRPDSIQTPQSKLQALQPYRC